MGPEGLLAVAVLPWERGNADEVTLFLLPSHYIQTGLGFYTPAMYYILSSGLWDFSTKALSCVSDYLTQYSPGAPGPWLRETGARFQTTAGSTAESKVHMPITNAWLVMPSLNLETHQVGGLDEIPPGSLGIWCWIP